MNWFKRANRTVIHDDGTPACLPAWARDELVRRRLAMFDLQVELTAARHELRVAQGMSPEDAFALGLGEMRHGGKG